jgi:hypothetical protein
VYPFSPGGGRPRNRGDFVLILSFEDGIEDAQNSNLGVGSGMPLSRLDLSHVHEGCDH